MKSEIVIIGAGASGLMAARELSRSGKKVVILEARDRIGGRIWPLDEKEFGYPAQGGAEFTHGPALVTKSLVEEAGLTYISRPKDGERWSILNGELVKNDLGPVYDPAFAPYKDEIKEKLYALKEDISIAEFLRHNFAGEKYQSFRDWIIGMVKGYDAADPEKISSFTLREEWLGEEEWEQGKVKEGYGALLNFLESECEKNGVEILLNHKVESIEINDNSVEVVCQDGEKFEALRVIVTLPLPVLNTINYTPALLEKMEAAAKIGFGGAVKVILSFKDRWWVSTIGKDLNKMAFMIVNKKIRSWWTQYPALTPVLVGWTAGPATEEFKDKSDEEILNIAINSLAEDFQIDVNKLQDQLVASKVINWPNDPLALGAYSYSTPEAKEACVELRKPVSNKLFFAGEALCSGKESATVEGALSSGLEVANAIKNLS